MSEGNSSAELNSGQALVLSGGGARAAYQVGCLRAFRNNHHSYTGYFKQSAKPK